MLRYRSILAGVPALLLASSLPSHAASHLWVINEVFSNSDGSVQFIEMHNPTNSPSETMMVTRWVRSTGNINQFDFPENLPPGSTAFAYLLLGTQGYADLPGAPAPDYILPDNFLNPTADDLEYWMYVVGDLAYTPGQLPLDGVNALQRDGSPGVNSPTNFNGQSGSINLSGTDAPVVAGAGAPLEFRLLTTGRNQFLVEFAADRSAEARLEVIDVRGRVVRQLFSGTADGNQRIGWNADDSSGRPVPSGVYFVRLAQGPVQATKKAAVVR